MPEYEAAARYRDRLDAMQRMAERQKVLAMSRYDQDLFGLARAFEDFQKGRMGNIPASHEAR